MASVLFRIGRFCFRNKWWIVAVWLAALVAVGSTVGALGPKFSKDFEMPGTDAGVAMDQLEESFPEAMEQMTNASTSVLVQADDGLENHTGDIDALTDDLQGLPEVDNAEEIVSPVMAAQAQPEAATQVLSEDGTIGLIQVDQDIDRIDLTPDDMDELTDILDEHRGGGLDVEATGALMQVMDPGGTAELIGFAVAFVVMVVAFGALIAAFIPLVTGIAGVAMTVALFTLGAEFLSIQDVAISIITMLGIAVSIDYALFIVSRYRSEVQRGGTREDAVGRAVGTAGSAVVFAGLTVVVAVAALTVIGIPMVTQMGVGAAMAVVAAVVAALTLIPALLGVFGRFAFAPRIPWIRQEAPGDDDVTNGVRFGRTVVRRPIPFIVAGLALLAIAAVPMGSMKLGLDMESDEEGPALDLMAEGFGEGINGPLMVVLQEDAGDSTDLAAAADQAVEQIGGLDNVDQPETMMWQGNGPMDPEADPMTDPASALGHDGADSALIMVTPDSSPSSEATHDLMEEIRDLAPQITQNGTEMHVGGETAITSDLSAKLDSALVPYLIVVVGLAFLIMVGVFRSLWVPLVGTLGFVFSMLATFGITVAVFQEGWLGLIDHTQPILSFLPIFLIGLVFGLAMDYQVFLMTRMREEYQHGLGAKEAIIAGYRHGSRVVSSAAVIMISVFAAFMLDPDSSVKMIGFALAIAVLFDAFIIRMTVVPAVVAMLGDRAWGLPKWLDKLVLNFDIEGTSIKNRGLEDASSDDGPGGGAAEPVGAVNR